MRRIAALAPLAVLAGVLVARRRRRRSAAAPPSQAPRPAGVVVPEQRFVSVPWSLAAAPGERPELALRCHQDDRLVLDRVDAQETPTQVFVTALARRQPRRDGEPRRGAADAIVALSRPLGTRELIPAPVDAPLYP